MNDPKSWNTEAQVLPFAFASNADAKLAETYLNDWRMTMSKTHDHAEQLAEALNLVIVAAEIIDGQDSPPADDDVFYLHDRIKQARAALSAWERHNAPTYESRVRAYEAEGMTRSDAQSVADAEVRIQGAKP